MLQARVPLSFFIFVKVSLWGNKIRDPCSKYWQKQKIPKSLSKAESMSLCCTSVLTALLSCSQALRSSLPHRRTLQSTSRRTPILTARQRPIPATWPTPGSGKRTTSSSRSKVMIGFIIVHNITHSMLCGCFFIACWVFFVEPHKMYILRADF